MRIFGRLGIRIVIGLLIVGGIALYQKFLEKRYNYNAPVTLPKDWKPYTNPVAIRSESPPASSWSIRKTPHFLNTWLK